MIGSKIVAAALLLPALAAAFPKDVKPHLAYLTLLKDKGYIKNGEVQLPVAVFCNPKNKGTYVGEYCASVTEQAQNVHAVESYLFCSHKKNPAKYDPLTGLCQYSLDKMSEDKKWPGKNCNKTTTCYSPFEAHWNPSTSSCACAIDTFPRLGIPPIRFEPHPFKDKLYGPTKTKVQAPIIDKLVEQAEKAIKQVVASYDDAMGQFSNQHVPSYLKGLHKLMVLHAKLRGVAILHKLYANLKDLKVKATYLKMSKLSAKLTALETKSSILKRKLAVLQRQAIPDAVSLVPLPTYIPPPNTEVTQELIQESLLIQPQQIATVHSVIPSFANGIITFLIQLDGPVSQTLALNATDSLPCETIGAQPQPHLILVPKTVKNGSSETALATCLVIAVNMYNPNYITYWVQKEDGSVFSLLSDGKIHAIDQLDTSQPAAIAIRVAPIDNDVKRDVDVDASVVTFKRRQIFSIACDGSCPFYHMQLIKGNGGYCGCMFKSAITDVAARGVEQPSPYTATMTAEACAAMTCINNGGKPALFNHFTATCWCASPTFVEENENAYAGGM